MYMGLWQNFWKFTISFDQAILQLGLIMLFMLVANVIRRKVKFVRRSLLPTAAIGGLLILIAKQIPFLSDLFNNHFLEFLTYHSLAIGCIAIALKASTMDKKKKKENKVLDAGLITVNTYLLQGIIGALLTVGLYLTFMQESVSLFVAGLLLPLGFGQGSAQALNFGQIYETQWGFNGGASFGLTLAALGFLFSCFVGVYHLTKLRKQGKFNLRGEKSHFTSVEETSSPNDVALSDSIDRFTIQIAFILVIYVCVYLFYLAIVQLPNDGFVGDTVKPLIIGFNFLFGTIFATIAAFIFKRMRKTKLMTHVYPNNYLLNRISGFVFDVMIIAGIGAIQIQVLKDLLIPLILLVGVGLFVTYHYVYYVSKKTFPDYQEQAFLSLFGMLTGTNSTGIILLREIDPQFETPAATNLILQSIYAIAFGFPLLLLLGIAPRSLKLTLLSLGIMLVMFFVFNALLFRKKVFKKLAKNK